MKRNLFIVLAAVYCLGYSCKKTAVGNSNQSELSTASPAKSKPESVFSDPSGLISPSKHGVLDTIQKGFEFTEGRAVDRSGSVYFTDEPNDKIYRWDGARSNVTTFCAG